MATAVCTNSFKATDINPRFVQYGHGVLLAPSAGLSFCAVTLLIYNSMLSTLKQAHLFPSDASAHYTFDLDRISTSATTVFASIPFASSIEISDIER